MSVGAIAGLIAAIAFAVIAGVLIYPMVRLGRLFDAIAKTVEDAGNEVVPVIKQGNEAVGEINKTLSDVNSITDSVKYTAQNAAALGNLYTSILGKPIIKAASFLYAFKKTASSFMKGKSKAAGAEEKK
ncbi:MAG: DUF948 domain-containing protein [Aeriscardovia sp.]|nr:DUF948 domain-containing protein [Aeriscardovia sp.]MBQ1301148.1 DUF948 domain-containing protein [Aeriscardovia sp.]MBQ1357388.1 DUF948 domain-containing protein [Aeriscardovia sp.]MBQ1425048.1 DUF948 domain-containing protein [Aeriscardovia sp.]MBQ5493314.1 DUF948 domain-containing protein [Aeriscardovia sp.]